MQHREYSSKDVPMDQDAFTYEMSRMFALCGLTLNDARAKIFFDEFKDIGAGYLKAAFRRIIESPPAKITAALIRQTLREIMPQKKREYIQGCEYCEVGATIPYIKIINSRPYQYVAKCPKCRQSPLKHLPWYDEEMPHDVLQPRPKEREKDGRAEIQRLIKSVTRGEGQDRQRELYRQRILNGQREYEREYENSQAIV
ncbi:MAG: hypothetical protein FJ119_10765 [Deltaproteobacteria bacterium]|nr:hypothetical protein [Deltaproteobacteria bacterium]